MLTHACTPAPPPYSAPSLWYRVCAKNTRLRVQDLCSKEQRLRGWRHRDKTVPLVSVQYRQKAAAASRSIVKGLTLQGYCKEERLLRWRMSMEKLKSGSTEE